MDGSRLKKVASQLAIAVAGGLVAVTLTGAGPVGAFSVPNNSVNSAKIVNNSVQSIDIKDGTIEPGDLTVRAATRWAKVNAGMNTELIRGRGVENATREGVGGYLVEFAQPITNCAWNATLIHPGAGLETPMVVTLYVTRYTDTSLWVQSMYDDDLADMNDFMGFALTVHC